MHGSHVCSKRLAQRRFHVFGEYHTAGGTALLPAHSRQVRREIGSLHRGKVLLRRCKHTIRASNYCGRGHTLKAGHIKPGTPAEGDSVGYPTAPRTMPHRDGKRLLLLAPLPLDRPPKSLLGHTRRNRDYGHPIRNGRIKMKQEKKWWAMKDLNLRPLACEASALTTELIARFGGCSGNKRLQGDRYGNHGKSGRNLFSRWVWELQSNAHSGNRE
jgi:hypothetical protein